MHKSIRLCGCDIRCDQAVSAHQKVGGHALLSGGIGGQRVGVQRSALALIRREIQSLRLLDSVVLLIYLVEGVGYLRLLCADRFRMRSAALLCPRWFSALH